MMRVYRPNYIYKNAPKVTKIKRSLTRNGNIMATLIVVISFCCATSIKRGMIAVWAADYSTLVAAVQVEEDGSQQHSQRNAHKGVQLALQEHHRPVQTE